MNAEQAQSNFEGFAILEIFGHQKYAGYVKTVYYGTACMFQCDVPPLPESEQISKGGTYVDFNDIRGNGRQWVPPGSTVKKPATEAYSKLFGIGAIYSMTPCDEKACLAAVAELQPRPLMLVKLPEGKVIAAVADTYPDDQPDDEEVCPGCGKTEVYCRCDT